MISEIYTFIKNGLNPHNANSKSIHAIQLTTFKTVRTNYSFYQNHELRRYDTRPLRLNWGPGNVHFGKTRF